MSDTLEKTFQITTDENSFVARDNVKRNWPFDGVNPRQVQLRALSKLYGIPGAAFFMRQRLGKTWTAYAEFSLLRDEGKVDWMVIICPNTLKKQWLQAIEEVDFFTPVLIYNASEKHKADYFFSKNKTGGVIIVNYESVKGLKNNTLVDITINKRRAYIAADESTKIKDPTSQQCKMCVEYATDFLYKRILTGRPTANTNLDIWAQLRFIGCTTRNFFQHKHYFCVMGGFQGRQVKKNINVEVLQAEIEPISYIAEDKYVTGFEKVYEPMRRVPLTGRLLELYKGMERDLLIEVSDESKITAPIVLTKYLRLQQISSGIVGDIDGMQQNLVPPDQNPRIKVVKDIIENEITNKVIIVCRFRLSMKNLYEELTKAGYKVAVLTGLMKPEAIEEAKRRFNEEDYDILISQIQVLSFGHTLCARDDKPCDSMIFYETDFSLINRAQCESRPEKMERKSPISYYDLYASKMDRYLLDNLIKKEEASLALMNYSRAYGMRPDGLNIEKEVDED